MCIARTNLSEADAVWKKYGYVYGGSEAVWLWRLAPLWLCIAAHFSWLVFRLREVTEKLSSLSELSLRLQRNRLGWQ